MSSNTQKKLSKVRPPRVHITYDVETGGETKMKELPLVVGVLADLSGKSEVVQPKLKDRKFIDLSSDTLNDVMKSIKPRVEFPVKNKLTSDGGKFKVDLEFEKMEDFEPFQIVQKIPQLKKLYEARCRLEDLNAKLDGNDELEELLQDVVSNTEQLEEIKNAVAPDEGGDAEESSQDEEAASEDEEAASEDEEESEAPSEETEE